MKRWFVSISFAILAIVCVIGYRLMGGARVLADGTLQEPFFLIPLGWIFAVASILSFVVTFIFKVRKTKKDQK